MCLDDNKAFIYIKKQTTTTTTRKQLSAIMGKNIIQKQPVTKMYCSY